MDLRKPVVVGADIDNPFTQLVYGGGYDHNWILNAAGDINKVAAKLYLRQAVSLWKFTPTSRVFNSMPVTQ